MTTNIDNFKLKDNAYGYHKKECAENYRKGRPSYCKESIDFIKSLGLSNDSVMVDLAAGPGKFTEVLAKEGGFNNITAVEPSPDFREQANQVLQTVKDQFNPSLEFKVLEGLSTSIPLPDNSVDCLTAATAFHWFANIESIKEISRVLKPNGLLVIVWNRPDPENNVPGILENIVQLHKNPKYNGGNKSPTSLLVEKWRNVFDEIKSDPKLHCLVDPDLKQSPSIKHIQTTYSEKVIASCLSMSYISLLPPAEKQAFIDDLKENLENNEHTKNNQQFNLNYSTEIFYTRKPEASIN